MHIKEKFHVYSIHCRQRVGGGNLKYVEQRELHQCREVCPHDNDNDDIISPPTSTSSSSNCHPNHEAKSIIDTLKSTKIPESVLEPVLHGRSVAMNGFVEQMCTVTESEISESTTVQSGRDTACKGQKTDSPQSVSTSCACTSDSKELSPVVSTTTCTAATTVESSPSSCCILTTVNHPPIATSATQQPIVSTSPVSVACSGTKELIPAGPGGVCTMSCMPEMVCASERSVKSHFSPQLHVHVHVQRKESAASSPMSNLLKNQVDQPGVQSPIMSISSTDSSPTSSTVSAAPRQEEVIVNPEQFLNSISDCGAPLAGFSQPPATMLCSAYRPEIDPMLHTMSGSDSIPSVSTAIPFHNPNFTPQARDFNPRIPLSFNFSNNNSICQSFDNSQNTPFTDNSISAVPMPTAGTHTSNFDISNMLANSDNSLTQQLIISEDSLMDKTSLDTLTTSLPHPTASVDRIMVPIAHSYPQTNLASDSNLTASLQDPIFCSSTHLNADLASQVLVDSPTSSFHSPISCSSNAEVQDILQQFM